MKIAFKILPPTSLNERLHLLIEQGDDEIHFAFYQKAPLRLEGFYSCSFEKHLSPGALTEKLRTILESEEIFASSFQSVRLFLNHRRSFIRNSFDATTGFDDVHGADKRYDRIMSGVGANGTAEADLFRPIADLLTSKFPGIRMSNSLACHRQHISSDGQGRQLMLMVNNNNIRISVSNGGELRFVQYFEYASPTDVCYYLLATCKELNIAPENTTVLVGGMLAKSSNLYEEIEKYFAGIEFLMLKADSSVADELLENPVHFYSHFSYLACE